MYKNSTQFAGSLTLLPVFFKGIHKTLNSGDLYVHCSTPVVCGWPLRWLFLRGHSTGRGENIGWSRGSLINTMFFQRNTGH